MVDAQRVRYGDGAMRGSGNLLFAFVLGWSVACGGRSSSQSSTGSGAETISGCPVPDLGQCSTAPYLLSCKAANGGGAVCISDDATQCPSCSPNAPCVEPAGVTYVCQDQCSADEYGAVCGSPDPNVVAGNPPAACRSMGVTPGGAQYYCCPCVS
jgi:hypothetical protein